MTPMTRKVLAILATGEQTGRHLREVLNEDGYSLNRPAFYFFMGEVVDKELASGRYETKTIDGTEIKEMVYAITEEGMRALEGEESR